MRIAAFTFAVIIACAPLGARASLGVQTISGKTIAALAQAKVALLARSSSEAYVAIEPPTDQVVSDGPVHLRAQSPIGSASFVNVPVQIEVQGRLDRTVLVGYRLVRYITTAVAAHDLPSGTLIGDDDVRMERVAFTGTPGTQAQTLVGRRTIGSFAQGTPVSLNETAENQLVRAGSTVVFTIRTAGIAVTADTIARTSGGLGDEVFVYNPATRKQLSGTVTGPNTVELDITEDN